MTKKYIWRLGEDREIQICTIYDRYHVKVWPFGDIKQCAISIDNEFEAKPARIGLEPSKRIDTAKRKGIKWVEEYHKNFKLKNKPFMTFLETEQDCFKYYPSLFETRNDVINQLFFVIGNGYDWLDGGLISGDQEPKLLPEERSKNSLEKLLESFENFDKKYKDFEEKYKDDDSLKDFFKKFKEVKIEKEISSANKNDFYPICEYSKIVNIPNNITKDWLEVSWTAAKMLENDIKKENRKWAKKIIQDLENRFGKI